MSIAVTIAEVAFSICALIFVILRAPHEMRAKREPVRVNRRSLPDLLLRAVAILCFGILPIAHILTGVFAFADYPYFAPLAPLGILVFVFALWLFYRAHHDLGRRYSNSLEIRADHEIVSNGVYRWVRHPMYLGFLLWGIAQLLLLSNYVVAPAGLVAALLLIFLRIPREERMLLDTFGNAYRDYAARTARLVPGLY